MTRLPLCGLAAVLLFALQPTAAGAQAKDTLATAIAKADAKHVAAEDPPLPPDESPKLTTGWDDEPGQGQTRSISSGSVKVSVTYRKVLPKPEEEAEDQAEPEPEAEIPANDLAEDAAEADKVAADAEAVVVEEEPPQPFQVPVVTVTVGGRQVAKLEGEDISWEVPPVGLQIAELDKSNRHPEVVVSFYTGGAHCCSITKVVTSNRAGRKWSVVDVGQFDGGPATATDLDGDGRYEFADRDNAFLYAFGCYACSTAPLKVMRLEGNGISTVSSDPAYRSAHVSWLKGLVAQAQTEEVDANAFLAGYVAQKILLGEGAEAWAIMEAHYDRENGEGLEQCDQLRKPDASCPGKTIKGDYPSSLALFLNLRGYPAKF